MRMIADEWRITSREPLFRWACVLLALLTVGCLWNGYRFKVERDAQVAAEITRSLDKRDAEQETLRRVAAGLMPAPFWGAGEPNVADWNAARPAGPLAALSFGREDIEPFSTNVSLFMVRADNLFRKYEFGSPLALAAGRFDAGFLLVLLLPLFALALTYNVIAEERETGRLRLAAIQGNSVGTRLMVRLLLRMSPVFACLVGIVITAAIWGAPVDRLAFWSSGALLYLAFWMGVAGFVASLPWRQDVLALTAACIWLGVVVLLPAFSVAIASSISPKPSSFEMINSVREASNRANRNIQENLYGYISDHPELNAVNNDEYWPAKLYASQRVVEEEIAPVRALHADRETRYITWLDRLRFFSPATTIDQVLTDSAGTGHFRQQSYVEQAENFLTRWGETLSPMIFQRTQLSGDEISQLPRFEFREPPVPAVKSGHSLLYLMLLALTAIVLAARRISFVIGRSSRAVRKARFA